MFVFGIIIGIAYITATLMIASAVKTSESGKSDDYSVSLLIPARNEDEVLSRCLDSIEKLDYPENKLQVILIDHNSSDDTLKLMKTFKKKSRFQTVVVQIKEFNPETSCKAEALRAGMKKATGELIALTDAEVSFEPGWLKSLAGYIKDGNDMAGGLVLVENHNFFDSLQTIEWLFLSISGAGFADMGTPQSMWGKNMILKRELYDKSGGFPEGKIWTEDMVLVQKCSKFGKIKMTLSQDCMVNSLAAPDLESFFRQKLRWLKGGLKIETPALTALAVSFLMNLGLLILLFTSVKMFLLLLIIRIISDILMLNRSADILHEYNLWNYIPIYSFFSIFFHTAIAAALPFSKNLKWR